MNVMTYYKHDNLNNRKLALLDTFLIAKLAQIKLHK